MYTKVSAYSHVPLFCHVARTWVACSVSSLLGTDLSLLRSSLLGISARMTAWWHVYWLHREYMGKSKEIFIYSVPNPTWKRGQLRLIPLYNQSHRLGFIKTLKCIALTEPLDVGLNSGHSSRSNCVLVLQGLDHLTSTVAVSMWIKKTCMFYHS